MRKYVFALIVLCIVNCMSCSKHKGLPPSDKDNGGLILPAGFEAVVVVDSLKGAARHIAVNDNGDLYVKLRFPQPEGSNVALRDDDNDGKADQVRFFADYADKGGYGTAMRIHNGYLYFSSTTRVYRQKLTGDLVPNSKMELLVTDTQPPVQHASKPVAFDKKGNMYVPFGAPSDCCQENDRTPFSPGISPCPILETRAGIWKFNPDKPNQFQWDGSRVASGLRSIVALDWSNEDDNLFAVMHGRDYLHANWPQYYSEWDGALLPSEEFLRLKEGANAGWPYYYYDQIKGKKLLSPEYGGDGKKEEKGASFTQPVIGFPGHFAPNDLLFYKGNQFPRRYKNGAFIAFHGSASSSPYPQSGYFVAFVPYNNGNMENWEVFADGFAGVDTIVNVSDAAFRPMGLSEGPDGSLYVSDSEKGKIWRIMFKGDSSTFSKKNLELLAKRKVEAMHIKTPVPVQDRLKLDNSDPLAQTYNLYCSMCHQQDGKGDARFPPLAGSEWVIGDPKLPINIVLKGLAGNITVTGKPYSNQMPKLSLLSDEQIAEAISYIRQHFNNVGPVTAAQVAEQRKLLLKEEKKLK